MSLRCLFTNAVRVVLVTLLLTTTSACSDRVGAVCRNGSQSYATGSGACSWNGGVKSWETKLNVPRTLAFLAAASVWFLFLGWDSKSLRRPTHSHHPRTVTENSPPDQKSIAHQQPKSLGDVGSNNTHRPDSPPEAQDYARIADDDRTGETQNSYGMQLLSGLGIKKDETTAAEWFRRSAALDNPAGIFNLALVLETGTGTERDRTEAHALYIKAAELGHPSAMNRLAQLYLKGDVAEKNPALALKWFEKGSDGGSPLASMNAGLLHEDGIGTIADKATALKYYRIALAQGSLQATQKIDDLIIDFTPNKAGNWKPCNGVKTMGKVRYCSWEDNGLFVTVAYCEGKRFETANNHSRLRCQSIMKRTIIGELGYVMNSS